MDPKMVTAICNRDRRISVWKMIHEACEWKSEEANWGNRYCIKAWEISRMLKPCSADTCPLADGMGE